MGAAYPIMRVWRNQARVCRRRGRDGGCRSRAGRALTDEAIHRSALALLPIDGRTEHTANDYIEAVNKVRAAVGARR
jgi:hypothetical protein